MNSTMFTTAATVKRLTQVADKSSYAATGTTVYGLFQPVDPDTRLKGAGLSSKTHTFHCDGASDIETTDFLTIGDDDTDYAVRGTRRFTLQGIDFLEVGLELAIKQ